MLREFLQDCLDARIMRSNMWNFIKIASVNFYVYYYRYSNMCMANDYELSLKLWSGKQNINV